MSVRFTKEEKVIRDRAEAALADPNTADWHRRRFAGDLKRTQANAEARAKQREGSNPAQPKREPVPNGITPEAWKQERERVRNFLAAVAAGAARFGPRAETKEVDPTTQVMEA